MSTEHLPEDEPGSIPWEGGEENKGDEPGETPNPKEVTVIDDAASTAVDKGEAKLEADDNAEDDEDF